MDSNPFSNPSILSALQDTLKLHSNRVGTAINNLEVEPVRLGCREREVIALDSSTIVRLRCQVGKAALLGKGYCHRAGRAVRANLVAAAVSVVLSGVYALGWCGVCGLARVAKRR
jgi:hypothetical protein